MTDKRTAHVMLRITMPERLRLEVVAINNGKTAAAWVRDTTLAAIRRAERRAAKLSNAGVASHEECIHHCGQDD